MREGFTSILIVCLFFTLVALGAVVYFKYYSKSPNPINYQVKDTSDINNQIQPSSNLHRFQVGSLLTLASFTDSKSNYKFIVSKTVPEKGYEDLTAEEIYLGSNKENLSKAKKILETGTQSDIDGKPKISSNKGKKYFALQLVGSGDVNRMYLYDENGIEIKLDLSQIKDNELTGTSSLKEWINDTTTFVLELGSFGPNGHEAIFDASTGKQVGADKLIPNE